MVKCYTCIVCNKRAKQRDRQPVPANVRKFLKKNLDITYSENDVVCSACRIKYYRAINTPKHPSQLNERGDADPSYEPPSTNERLTSPPSVSIIALSTHIPKFFLLINIKFRGKISNTLF